MIKKLTALFFTICSLTALAQQTPTEKAKPIVDEGKRLYKSEMASWYGTDLFLESYKDQSTIGGYFSYTEDQLTKCIFFSNADDPAVIGTISFDSTYNTKTAKVDLRKRNFTKAEYDLFAIRKISLQLMNSDTMFKIYKNTNFNLIPIIDNNERKVYVLSGTSQQGMVIFGNDYLLTFTKDNELLTKKAIHKNIIPISIGDDEKDGKEIVGTMHTHLPETGDFITATDICTLMLYAKLTKWKQHSVASKNYLTIWNCTTNSLIVLPMDVVKKIDSDQNKNKKVDN